MNNTPLSVINIVGLTPSLLGEHTPNINKLIAEGFVATLDDSFPAVTCSAQSTMLTGCYPQDHGIVGNGWYSRDIAEAKLWRQSNHLVKGEKVWDALKNEQPGFVASNMFWWYNMYSSVDYSVTPRPAYPADGRKLVDIYSQPASLQQQMKEQLGDFPFFQFWGPDADIRSSAWIAKSAMLEFDMHRPQLQLVYLPHLDYNLQRIGPNDPKIWQDVADIDRVAGELIDHLRSKGAEVMIVSEYGINEVNQHVNINRVLRENGYISVRDELEWEMLDSGASRAFAVPDHQVANIYIKDPKDIEGVKKLLESTPGIERVLDDEGKREFKIDHRRAGELVAISNADSWFTYYYWLDDNKAPDYARTVDIHRKPGYDPVELFLDQDIPLLKAKILFNVAKKMLGFRMLMDVVPLTPGLVKGSHGRLITEAAEAPLLISTNQRLAAERYPMHQVKSLIIDHFNGAN
ncbi:MAG: alkaline phosphatase family protein [Pseudomonadales bacterium]|nr:alkaline phosphatase family protein [Pseudomonadales bacterium]